MTCENYAFAGHTDYGEANLKEMAVYVTIAENDSLKLGVRTSNKQSNGTMRVQQSPMFRIDYFRLTKLDPAKAGDADLANITLSSGSLNFSPETTTYTVKLPAGTETVTAIATANLQDVTVTGAGTVDVSSGSGISTITVTALDGITTKTYTINYTVDSKTGVNEVSTKCTYFVRDRKLTVEGTDAYVVYDLNGIKIADVKSNMPEVPVELIPGVYIVKATENETFKVTVR
ncbi:MAG: hypothetical protein BGO29_13525 [Bacteroidales bacterium 36-12]|nr:MAG: hypothetical protein BGO29_13525 [Bacteroidales bacterium 36-12]